MVATFVSVLGAFAATLTTKEIGGKLAPGPMESDRVQVTL
jgi:hypothetical protein